MPMEHGSRAKGWKLLRTVLAFVITMASAGRAEDVVNTASVSFAGVEGPVTLATNTVRMRKIDPLPLGGTLFVQKSASRSVAEIGEYVDFTVRVKNASNFKITGVIIGDNLPFGFACEPGSTRIAGAKIVDPPGPRGPNLTFSIGDLEVGQTVELNYRTRIGVDAFHGDG